MSTSRHTNVDRNISAPDTVGIAPSATLQQTAPSLAEEIIKLAAGVPYLEKVADLAVKTFESIVSIKSAKDDVNNLAQRVIESTNALVRNATASGIHDMAEDLKQALDEYRAAVDKVRIFVEEYGKRGVVRRAINNDKDNRQIIDLNGSLDRASKSFTEQLLVAVQRDVTHMKKKRRLMDVRTWLAVSSSRSSHNAAVGKRFKGTGIWFVEGNIFKEWLSGSKPVLWLNGIPGCGKSVLCSSAIENVEELCSKTLDMVVAYYYFDFKNTNLNAKEGRDDQWHDNMLRSLLSQLLRPYHDVPGTALERLFSAAEQKEQVPTTAVLTTALKDAIHSFKHSYILIDALDECPVLSRPAMLGLVHEIINWKLPNLSILLTSRREADIERNLISKESSTVIDLPLDPKLVNADIEDFIHAHLSYNDAAIWKTWPTSKTEELESALKKRTHGMFLLASCQLQILYECNTLKEVQDAMISMPDTLQKMYDQILSKIKETDRKAALKILQWLVFSARPMTLDEIAEVVALDIDSCPLVDPNMRWPKHRQVPALQAISSTLVTITTSTQRGKDEVGLAHSSVKEFFLLLQTVEPPTAWYYVDKESANIFICHICLLYLLQFDTEDCLNAKTVQNYPLAFYAAKFWATHALTLGAALPDSLQELVMTLLKDQTPQYSNMLSCYHPELLQREGNLRTHYLYMPPLYYSSYTGLQKATSQLLLKSNADVNAQGGQDGNALQVASGHGHLEVVKLLLGKGADVNAQGGEYGTALEAASANEQWDTATLLSAYLSSQEQSADSSP